MRQTFSISFVCRDSKVNKQGLAPLECSISINSTRVVFALPRKEKPSTFKKAMASSRNTDLKRYTSLIYAQLQEVVTNLTSKGVDITAQSVKTAYFAKETKYTLLDAINDYLTHSKAKIDIDITLDCWQKYRTAKAFLTENFDCSKPLDEITVGDLLDIKSKLLKKYKPNTANSYLSRLRTFFLHAKNNGKLLINPFSQMKIGRQKMEITYLTRDQVNTIANKDFGTQRLNDIRDLFIFQCLTALSYSDAQMLTAQDIKTDEQGRRYIQKRRKKTDVEYTVLLLPMAIGILERHNYILPRISNQKMNSYLKEIGTICGIEQTLHSHLARHTAATLMLNSSIPIEIVSKVLGHSNIRITQAHYAKVLDSTVLDQMSKML